MTQASHCRIPGRAKDHEADGLLSLIRLVHILGKHTQSYISTWFSVTFSLAQVAHFHMMCQVPLPGSHESIRFILDRGDSH